MNTIKAAVALASLITANATYALTACGFVIPPDSARIFSMNRDCEVVFRRAYGLLNYLYLFSATPLKDVLSDSTFISTAGGAQYFVFDWIDDPLVTIHPIRRETAKPLLMQRMTGIQAKSTFFAQFLPTADQDPNESFSGNLRCITAAGGTDKKSFKAQFCAPLTARGKRDLRTFESVLKAIRPD